MGNLRRLSPTKSREYAGTKGLGIRAFCKSAAKNKNYGLGPQLVALRNIQGLQIVTNAIVGSHTESRDGFVEAESGLRDAGNIEFDCNFVPEYAAWQHFRDQFLLNSDGTLSGNSFMSGLFGVEGNTFNQLGDSLEDVNAHHYDFYIAFPNSLTLIHCYGFPSMLGPITGAMESIIMSQFAFKISGSPALMRPMNAAQFDAIPAGAQAAPGGASKSIGRLASLRNNSCLLYTSPSPRDS